MDTLEFPNRITVELTNSCNVSCTFCPRQSVPMEIGYMDETLYKKIIDEAANHLPVKLVLFFRGESLLHPQFIDFLKYAKTKKIGPIQFASNALAMNESIMDEMLDAGIDFISFSLDTLDPVIYNSSRCTGNLEASMENVIRMSCKCKERRKEGLPVPTLQVSTIEIADYMAGQQDFIDFWKQHVDVVRVYYEHDDRGRFRNLQVQEELENELKERRPCRKIFTDFLVYWNGELALCNYDWNGNGLKGLNVREMSISDIWNSDIYQNIRKMHNENLFATDIMCKDCQHWRIDYTKNGYLGKSYKGEAEII